jgi:hypothetical protein
VVGPAVAGRGPALPAWPYAAAGSSWIAYAFCCLGDSLLTSIPRLVYGIALATRGLMHRRARALGPLGRVLGPPIPERRAIFPHQVG